MRRFANWVAAPSPHKLLLFGVPLISAAIVGAFVLSAHSARGATLRSMYNCTNGWKVAMHVYGPSTATNSTNVNYTVQGKNCTKKTLKHIHFLVYPSSLVVQPVALQDGKIAMRNLRPHQRYTVKLVLNFPSEYAGARWGFSCFIYSGRHEVGGGGKDVTIK